MQKMLGFLSCSPIRPGACEAWPTKTPEQRDSELKRRFEDGLSNMEMSHYLRLHARDCDFAATVLKARQYADAAESTRLNKIVKILK